jgi:hypothetical protein
MIVAMTAAGVGFCHDDDPVLKERRTIGGAIPVLN